MLTRTRIVTSRTVAAEVQSALLNIDRHGVKHLPRVRLYLSLRYTPRPSGTSLPRVAINRHVHTGAIAFDFAIDSRPRVRVRSRSSVDEVNGDRGSADYRQPRHSVGGPDIAFVVFEQRAECTRAHASSPPDVNLAGCATTTRFPVARCTVVDAPRKRSARNNVTYRAYRGRGNKERRWYYLMSRYW